jgi:HEPN domain-containing protein
MKFKAQEFRAWYDQAERTLNSAKNDQLKEDHNWACFKAQQSAEFAMKAVLHGSGIPAFGHSVKILAETVATLSSPPRFDYECLTTLDKYYIPTRYADAFDQGSPFAYYTERDSERALECAYAILTVIKKYVSSLDDDSLQEKAKAGRTK